MMLCLKFKSVSDIGGLIVNFIRVSGHVYWPMFRTHQRVTDSSSS